MDELALFVRGPVVVFKWRNAEGWPVEYVSPNVVGIFGYSDEEFMSGLIAYAERIHPDDVGAVTDEVGVAARAHAPSFEHEPYRVLHRDGTVRWLHDVTYLHYEGDEVTHYVGYVVDITSRQRALAHEQELEAQLLHAQKLESLGVLAGGVAHDFNNLLTGILGEASLLRLDLDTPQSDPLRSVEQIELLARRAAELTRQLLAYSGKGRFVVRPLDVSELVRDIASMLKVVLSKKAALELNLADDLPAIEADRAQLQQVAMNLISNASDALCGEVGMIRVTTSAEHYTEQILRAVYGERDLPAGLYVVLEVSDDGCGMSKEVKARLFDPFFSTKSMGRGLGMSATLGIVRGHRGAIRVYSEPGRGTSFKLLFPASEASAVPLGERPSGGAWRSSGLVLVIDDEATVRRVATRMLERLGFTVLSAPDGAEALHLYRDNVDDVVLVLLDMMMPVMDGKETLSLLRRITPDLPVVMSSGFNEQEAISRLAGRGVTAFLQKPYKPSDMETAVRSALE